MKRKPELCSVLLFILTLSLASIARPDYEHGLSEER